MLSRATIFRLTKREIPIDDRDPVSHYTRILSLPVIYAKTKDPDILKVVQSGVSVFHGMQLLIQTACHRKCPRFLFSVLMPYIAQLNEANALCERAQKTQSQEGSPVKQKRIQEGQNLKICPHYKHFWSQYPSLGRLIRWLIEGDYLKSIKALEHYRILQQPIHCCPGTTESLDFSTYSGITSAALNGFLLIHFILDVQERWRPSDLVVLRKLLENGARISVRGCGSPVALALLHENPENALRILASKNADFGKISVRNPLQVPDSVYIALMAKPEMLPKVICLGGLQVHVGDKILRKNPTKDIHTCCFLAKYIGPQKVTFLQDLCVTFHVCSTCEAKHQLQSTVASLRSLGRLAHRAKFSPAQLLEEDSLFPADLPENLKNFVHFKANSVDSKEFTDYVNGS
ncbi:hypothetical protein L596_027221 [Steinernema carpocapsae]|uniref:Uncharacterized protein n=1 Tax=Steinernema carpocapsae TaxID=34508 RepID=A0A4U5M3U3_STECR|nr:hypothetical protein L596_027221 [Steinernema carpocapsae]